MCAEYFRLSLPLNDIILTFTLLYLCGFVNGMVPTDVLHSFPNIAIQYFIDAPSKL